VDRERLGVTGHSLGGHNSIFLAAYDPRIKCAVPSCSGHTLNENPVPLHWSRDYWYVYFPTIREQLLRGERIACDFHEMLALAAPTPMLGFLALNDGDPRTQAHRVLLHTKVHEVYRLLGKEEAHAFLVFGDGHAMPDLTRAALLSWFNRWLKHGGAANGGGE
jgi:dienelactone hydrolase